MIFPLLVLFAATAFAQVEDIGFITRVEGFFGNHWACQKATQRELREVDKCLPHYKMNIQVSNNAKQIENYMEELFFQEMAVRSHDSSKCQLQFLNSYVNNRRIAGTLNNHTIEIFQDIKPKIQELLSLRKQKSAHRSNLTFTNDPKDISNAEREKRLRAGKLASEIKAIDFTISTLLSQLPMGTHPQVKSAMLKLAQKPQPSSSGEIIGEYSKAMHALRTKMQRSVGFFQSKLNKDGLYTLNKDQKVAFVQSGQADELIQSFDTDKKTRQNLACRLKANYKNGPKTAEAVAIIGLTGASIATLGASSAVLTSLRGLAAFGVNAASYGEIALAAKRQCLAPTMNVSSQLVCDPGGKVSAAISEASTIGCATSAAFLALPVLAPFAKYLRPSRRAVPGTAASHKVVAKADEVVEAPEIVVTARRRRTAPTPNSRASVPTSVSTPQVNRSSRRVLPRLEDPKNLQHPTVKNWADDITSSSPELKPIFDDVDKAYAKGDELDTLKRELDTLKQQSPVNTSKVAEIEGKLTQLRGEVTTINNRFIRQMHALFQRDGIPSQILPSDKGHLVLEFDFRTPPPRNTRAYKFYDRVKKAFGLEKVTLSLYDNIEAGSMGFFQSGLRRMEVGPMQGVRILDEYVNVVGRHESRHAMFMAKKDRGVSSIFHTRFVASENGNLLNDVKFYDRYMSSEELYTFSTDMQSYARVLKDEHVSDLVKRASILDDISLHAQGLEKVASTQADVADSFIKSLDDIVGRKDISEFQFNKNQDGSFQIYFADHLKRGMVMDFVSPQETLAFKRLEGLQNELGQARGNFVGQTLQNRGHNVDEFFSRYPNRLSASEKNLLNDLFQDFERSAEARHLAAKMDESLNTIATTARQRLVDLKDLAVIQQNEAKKLHGFLDSYKNATSGGRPEQLQALRGQMFTMSKNVVETYKGFALNSP